MDFYDQFALARSRPSSPDDFAVHTAHGWTLVTSPTLPVIPVRDGTAGARRIGWLLGWPVHQGHLLGPEDSWSLGPGGHVEDRLYQLAGRWLCVLLEGRPVCYLDAGGTLAAVFSPGREALASTTTLLNHDRLDAFVADQRTRPALAPDQFRPGGLTSDPSAVRLMPNHRLDLTTWTPTRHWPVAPLTRVADADAHDEAGTVLRHVRQTVEAVAERHELVLPLTAGRDSRMLMAAARSVIDRVTFATFHYPDARRTDASYARVVSKRFGLRHLDVPLEPVDEATSRRYLERVGFDANDGKARDFDQGARRHLPLDRAWLTGFAGEVGRGYYWSDGAPRQALTAADLLERMHLPASGEALRAVRSWLDEVPHEDDYDLLDLLYLEQRVGCWASPQMYGAAPFSVNLVPLAGRPIVTSMLRLPVDYRRRQRLARDVVEAGWPELAALPYGRPPGLRGAPARVKQVGRSLRRRAHKLSVSR